MFCFGTKETIQLSYITEIYMKNKAYLISGSLWMTFLAGTCVLNWRFIWPPEKQIAILERKQRRGKYKKNGNFGEVLYN